MVVVYEVRHKGKVIVAYGNEEEAEQKRKYLADLCHDNSFTVKKVKKNPFSMIGFSDYSHGLTGDYQEEQPPKRVRYLFLMRPPMPGAFPREGLQEIGYDEGFAPSGHHVWGWAEYNRELTEKEIRDYELERAQEGGNHGVV